MSEFSEWYGKNIYRKNAADMIADIHSMEDMVLAEMEKTTEPGKWLQLMDRVEALQKERADIAESFERFENYENFS